MTARIDQLKSYLGNRPDDPFVLYALAIEYKNGGVADEALRYFAEVHRRFPEYVATYLHYGGLLRDQGDLGKAKQLFHEGMERAREKGENHALSELADALSLLEEV
jgi:tetratricopeptide (TPR) repeat protein